MISCMISYSATFQIFIRYFQGLQRIFRKWNDNLKNSFYCRLLYITFITTKVFLFPVSKCLSVWVDIPFNELLSNLKTIAAPPYFSLLVHGDPPQPQSRQGGGGALSWRTDARQYCPLAPFAYFPDSMDKYFRGSVGVNQERLAIQLKSSRKTCGSRTIQAARQGAQWWNWGEPSTALPAMVLYWDNDICSMRAVNPSQDSRLSLCTHHNAVVLHSVIHWHMKLQ